MSFNHYSKLVKIIEELGYIRIRKINEPTKTKRFNGEYNHYDFYYRLVDNDNKDIPYGKFQDIEKLATYLNLSLDELLIYVINN